MKRQQNKGGERRGNEIEVRLKVKDLKHVGEISLR